MNKLSKHLRIPLAMACVYLFWGGTYLGMKFALASLPPFLLAGLRFLIAGSVLYAAARLSGAPRPKWREWTGPASVGAFLLLGGNGGICWAEQYIPSGVAALMAATMPLCTTLIGWLVWRGKRPKRLVVLGLLVGFGGIALMTWQSGQLGGDGRIGGLGLAVCALAVLSWSFGSTLSPRAKQPASPILATAMQQLSGGALLLLVAAFTGDYARFDAAGLTWRAVLSFAYLVVFGSLVAYSAYVWLLRNADLAFVSTYTYVNPLVAVLLGWLLADEPVRPGFLVSVAVILTGVLLVNRFKDGAEVVKKTSVTMAAEGE